MGLMDIKGLGFLKNMDLSKIGDGIGLFFLTILVFVCVAGLMGYIFYSKNQKRLFSNKIHWFEEVNGQMSPTGMDLACELIIPNTNISVFYIKSKDMYLPRPTKKTGKKEYWYCVKNNREIVNFTMKNMNDEMEEANLDYDHTDMRYGLAQLKELIKRNYKDKAEKWWQAYKDVITLTIFIVLMTVSAWFILSKLGDLVSQIGDLINVAERLIDTAEATGGSGITTR